MSATAFQNACGEIITITREDNGRMTVVYPGLTLLSQTGMLVAGNLLEVEGQRYTLTAQEALSIRRAMEQLSPTPQTEIPRPDAASAVVTRGFLPPRARSNLEMAAERPFAVGLELARNRF